MTLFKEKMILMFKNKEVLSFEVDYENSRVYFLKKLEYFDKAPIGLLKENIDLNLALNSFIDSRLISVNRYNYDDILKGTNSKDGFELSFKGHGLSLSNHYWYKKEGESLKYEDISFFKNKWDDSFARALLFDDYESLKNCDLNVPDIVTPGWANKGWIFENEPKLVKVGLVKDCFEDCLGEVLASRLAQRLFNEDEVVNYELRKIKDKYASVSSLIINEDEELIPLSEILPASLYMMYRAKNLDKTKNEEFYKLISENKLPGLYQFFVKIQCFRSLCCINDLHFDNLSVIRNVNTGKIRIAPLYDLAGAFGSSQKGRDFLKSFDKGSYLLISFVFGDLNPSWDYSWYNPNKLNGFEDEIRNILSLSTFYTPELIERILSLYHQQKSILDDAANVV